MKVLFLFAVAAGVVAAAADLAAAAGPKRPITIDDQFKFQRIAETQVSPDGKLVAYQATTVTDPDNNKSRTDIYIVPADGKSPPRQLTNSGKRDAHPRWSRDGSKILFESTRAGTPQLFVIDVTTGGEARQVTNVSTGAGTGVWSPDGNSVAFVSSVFPEFSGLPFAESDAKNREKQDALDRGPVKVKVFTKLFFRHWDEYVGDLRQHIFVVNLDGSGCRDITPGDRDANPTSSTFSVGDDFCFAPDGKHILFTAVPPKDESWSTNYDICRANVDAPTDKWESLTAANPAADNSPRFNFDGTKLAYRSQKKAGYEADKWDVLVVPVKKDGTFDGPAKNLTAAKDVSANEFCWGNEGGSDVIAFTADDAGANTLFQTDLDGKITVGLKVGGVSAPARGFITSLSTSTSLSRRVWAYGLAKMTHPTKVVVADFVNELSTGVRVGPLDHPNDTVLAGLDLPTPESVEIPVEGGVKMQMWVLKPPGFDPAKKWPVAYLIHGGPQGAWEDAWSFRWNPQVWAAQGYIVAMPNPRGSTGFGQKFVDEISGDWGGKCYRDLMSGLDYLEKLPFVDKDRVGSAGGSFGGYMQNWFAVSEGAKRFKCLISHCSVYNFESMWGTTDELWFDEFEHGGLPWEIPGKYREYSPHVKAGNLGKNKVPMLIIHNDLDFRCPIGQGHELFAGLQRQGVPSRFVNFPDEGHWVLKPANSKRWHQEAFAWLTKYVPPGGK